MITFNQRILCLGFGSVGKCTLPILLKHIRVPYQNVTVLDFADKREEILPWTRKGIRYVQQRVTSINYARILSQYVSPGGLIIDLTWNIDSLDMLRWCHENKVLYINTSVEEWDPYVDISTQSPFDKSLYSRNMEVREMIAKWDEDSTTAVLDHGANPGLISHFTKQGILDIAKKVVREKTTSGKNRKDLENLIRKEAFADLSMKLGIRTIHVSERDTQTTDHPKKLDEFVGTWSIPGLLEEAIAPAEMGWGTHEKELPPHATVPDRGPKNQVFLSQMGMNTWVRSWVPSCEIVGMVIRHSEAFSISERLTVWRNHKAVYRPTVHYVYMPCDATLASLHELRCRNYDLQPSLRIITDEVIKGNDALGALIMGHPYTSWWTGSILDIREARKLVPHQNATTIQVAIGVVAAVTWMIKNPTRGVCQPDDLPHDEVLKVAKPYLGTFVSEPSDWTPFKNYQSFFPKNPQAKLDRKNPWAFQNFLHRD
ncbi:MAG: saccharopine dehydrogenase C-terminal domain-containing protein [Candidatus Omnitrophota bacterium]|jgi:homospermidine synthase